MASSRDSFENERFELFCKTSTRYEMGIAGEAKAALISYQRKWDEVTDFGGNFSADQFS